MKAKTETTTKPNSSKPVLSGSTALGVVVCSFALLIASCGSTGTSRPSIPQVSSGSGSLSSMQNEINDLKRQLEDARQEILEVRAMSEEARAAADIAQTQAASNNDRIDEMFQRSVFK